MPREVHHPRSETELLDVESVLRLLGGISLATLYRLINERQLRVVKIRRRTFFRRADIELLIERSTGERN